MSTPTITRARPVHAGHMRIAYELTSQHSQLPAPTSVTVSTRDGIGVAIDMTVDTAADVDAWAEAMNVEVGHELHRDGTWTDETHGMLRVRLSYSDEHVAVHVYSPQAAARTEVR